MIQTDILIIGAGPVGLFTVFEAGLLKLRCHLIDALPVPGGQCAEIYPKKPIYDIPAYPEILAGDLVDNLMKQIEPFKPGFTLGEVAVSLSESDGMYTVTTDHGTVHQAPVVAIAGGLGVFTPRKPAIDELGRFENRGIHYFIKDTELFRDKKVVISGGGDSALDWTIWMADGHADSVTLIHRGQRFRAHPDSVQKTIDLAEAGRIRMILDAEVYQLHGNGNLDAVTVKQKQAQDLHIDTEYWLPLFGLTPKLGPIADWGLEIEKNAIRVNNALDYQTNREGVYAVGDVNTYPGKLKLILCGFHESTVMVQSAFKRIYPDKRNVLKYTTVNGINGFDE